MITNDQKIRVFQLISSLSLVLSLLLISLNQKSGGYSVSFYDNFPIFFWILLMIPFIIPIFLIFNRKYIFNPFNLGVFLFFALYAVFVLLSIPFASGCIFYGAGDTHTHLGIVKDILKTNFTDISNFYPYIHIFISEVAIISDCSIETVSLFIPQIFYIFYIISFLLLACSLGFNKIEAIVITLFATLPVFGSWLTTEYIMPSSIGFFLFPMGLTLIIRSIHSINPKSFIILSVIYLTLFWCVHPESVLFFSLILIGILIGCYTLKANNDTHFSVVWNRVLFALITLVIGFTLFFFSKIQSGIIIQVLYDSLFLNPPVAAPPLVSLQSNITLLFQHRIKIGILEYGPTLVFLSMGAVFTITVIYKLFIKKYVSTIEYSLSIIYVFFVLVSIFFLLKGTGIGYHITRQLKYPIFISTLIVGYWIIAQMKKPSLPSKKSFLVLTIIILLILCPIIGIFNLFSSPIISSINYQPTESDISGMDIFFQYRDQNLQIIEIIYRAFQLRYHNYIYGTGAEKNNIDYAYTTQSLPPIDFGYQQNTKMGESYNQNVYMLIYPPVKTYYQIEYPELDSFWRYRPESYNRLEYDESINYIFSNGALKITFISSQ